MYQGMTCMLVREAFVGCRRVDRQVAQLSSECKTSEGTGGHSKGRGKHAQSRTVVNLEASGET